jgi:hypothetical protein
MLEYRVCSDGIVTCGAGRDDTYGIAKAGLLGSGRGLAWGYRPALRTLNVVKQAWRWLLG